MNHVIQRKLRNVQQCCWSTSVYLRPLPHQVECRANMYSIIHRCKCKQFASMFPICLCFAAVAHPHLLQCTSEAWNKSVTATERETMSLPNEDAITGGYGSSDETASLLVLAKRQPTIISASQSRGTVARMSSLNGPGSSGAKPVLTRQECTSSYLISPNSSQRGGSEESGSHPGDDDQHKQSMSYHYLHQPPRSTFQSTLSVNAASVPDLDAQYRLEAPAISISGQSCRNGHRGSVSGYQLNPHARCRTCKSCERRASTTPISSLYLNRSVSKESVRSHAQGHLSPHSLNVQQHIPPVLITSSPNSGSRIIRQSSQPEASNIVYCTHTCSQYAQNVSLRQLRDPSEGIAGIAADSLRINGAMRPFRQVGQNVMVRSFPLHFFCLFEILFAPPPHDSFKSFHLAHTREAEMKTCVYHRFDIWNKLLRSSFFLSVCLLISIRPCFFQIYLSSSLVSINVFSFGFHTTCVK